MRFMLQNDRNEAAAAHKELKDQIREHRDQIRKRTRVEDADRSLYSLRPLNRDDYVAMGLPAPQQFAFPDEYTHPVHTRFGRHELLPVDLSKMEPMDKRQQKRAAVDERLAHAIVTPDDLSGEAGGTVDMRRRNPSRNRTDKGRQREAVRAAEEYAQQQAAEDERDKYDETGGMVTDDEDDDHEEEVVVGIDVLIERAIESIESELAMAKSTEDIVRVLAQLQAHKDKQPGVYNEAEKRTKRAFSKRRSELLTQPKRRSRRLKAKR